jgi:hypothetical protein
MASKNISDQDRQCIAGCIFKYYGSGKGTSFVSEEQREQRYEQCLESCRIC